MKSLVLGLFFLFPFFVLAETLTFKVVVGEIFTLPNGGEFTYTDVNSAVVNFSVPPDFYTEDLELQLVSYPSSVIIPAKPAPSGKSFVGRVYDFDFLTLSGDSVPVLNEKVTISISYLESDITGLLEETLAPYRWGGSSWEVIAGSSLDTQNKKITFETANFSSFALFASIPAEPEPDEPTPTPSGGSSSGGFFPFFLNFFPPFLSPSPPVSPDFNNDNKVDITDLSILLYWWEKTGSEIIPYDLNRDGAIDIVDASILFYHWTG